jgi:Fur family peroxide stress response transcriptional regulator
MQKTTELLTTSLKSAGMRMTPQRAAICANLAERDDHPTAVMIYEELRPQFDSFSLATVYNTLDALVKIGVVNSLGKAGDGSVHYDADTEPHVNLACISCNQIVDIPSSHVQQLDDEITSTSGYKLLGARVLYYGLCPECQEKQEN